MDNNDKYNDDDYELIYNMASSLGSMTSGALDIFQREAQKILSTAKNKAKEIQNESMEFAERGASPH